jgi:tetratricopeptide (TPR) repeat protein
MLRLASRNHWLKGDGEPAQRLGHEAIAQVADDDSIELARALAHMAGLRMTAGTRDDAIEYADRAIALAERFDDTFALSNALVSKGSVISRTDPVSGIAIIDRGRQIAMRSGLAITASRGWNNMSLWLPFVGRSDDEQLQFVREGIAWAQAHGVEAGSLSFLRNMHAALLSRRGDFTSAIAEYEWIISNGGSLGWAAKTFLVLAREGPTKVRETVPELLRRAERAGESQGWVPLTGTAALVLYADGRRPEADELMTRYLARVRADEGVHVIATGPWHSLTLGLALLADSDELIDIVADQREAPDWMREGCEVRAVDLRDLTATRDGRVPRSRGGRGPRGPPRRSRRGGPRHGGLRAVRGDHRAVGAGGRVHPPDGFAARRRRDRPGAGVPRGPGRDPEVRGTGGRPVVARGHSRAGLT